MAKDVATRSLPGRVTGKLKIALDLMIWGDSEGNVLNWDEAARRAGLRTRAMRLALRKPHVRMYQREQTSTVLACASAKNISRAVAIRDQDMNRAAALGAIRFLEQGGEQVGSNGPVRTPGICIQIVDVS